MAWTVTVPGYYRDGSSFSFTTGNRSNVERWVEKDPDVEVDHAECATCDRIGGGFGPSHDGSPSCDSPPHCTCDRCF